MATESIQGLRYPLPSDPNDPPADIKNLADDVVGKLNMHFPTEGARNAAIPSPVNGMECYIGTGATAVKQIRHNGQWVRTWDASTQSLTLNTGFTASDGLGLYREGRIVFLEGTIRRTAGVFPTTFTTVANIPAEWRPNGFRRLPSAGFGSASANGLWVAITGGGDLQVAGMGASSDSAYLCHVWRLPS